MSGILLIAVIVLGVMLFDTRNRVKRLEQGLVDRPAPAPRPIAAAAAPAETIQAPAERPRGVRIVNRGEAAPPPPPQPSPTPLAPPPALEPQPAPSPASDPKGPAFGGFESLIGGRLPIWIGGAALVLAAFFLVRYSIENGLIGPGARVVLAALFGLVLLGASEATRRLAATRDDPRVAQALAGAGIASLYGTLYMAAELYGLVSALPAFVLMIAITGAALGLSLRHGPPTAIMGLIGGFAAPLVTGVDAAGVVPLLIYLALFTAGLFALSIHRGWMWLALAATGGGLLWPLALLMLVDSSQFGWVGLFALTLAIAASLALPRAGAGHSLLRLAPLITGLLQLLLIGPALDFTPLAWGLYALLAAATIVLGWRDPKLTPGAAAALALALVLLSMGMEKPAAPLAALALAVMFTAAGHALCRRPADGAIWTALALGGAAGPLLLWLALSSDLPAPWIRALLATAAALSCAALSFRFRDRASPGNRFDLGLAGGAALAAMLAIVAVAQVADGDWSGIVIALAAAALSAWAGHLRDGWTARIALTLFPAAALLPGLGRMLALLGASLTGSHLPYLDLPSLAEVARALALPGLIIGGACWLARDAAGANVRRIGIAAALLPLAATVYALVKQPLHISTPERFLTLGLFERVLITQALLAMGWIILTRAPRLRIAALALLAIGLFRLAWFDLALLNPLIVSQYVGSLPVLNLAVLHPALAALWLWLAARRLPKPRIAQGGSLVLTIVAVLGAVRQFVHGPILTATDVTTTENYLYSAVLLALALIWLWRGIMGSVRALRLVGLGLLTLVTLKVFLIDAAALEGILRILSFMGLGVALIVIGWAYSRFLARPVSEAGNDPPADPVRSSAPASPPAPAS